MLHTGEEHITLKVLTFRQWLVAMFGSLRHLFPFEILIPCYDRMEEGRAGGKTKIASSDLSFINFSTPAATHWNRLWQRKKENQAVR